LNQRLNISNDAYIRTTDEHHMRTAQKLWDKCSADIYLSEYEGYYLVREERYVTEREAKEWGYKDPVSGVELQKSKEESYFFKMSRYQDAILNHIKSNAGFIVPEQYRTEIISRLEADPLEDLCVSRTSFDWGIPVLNSSKHVMYVWFDALTNYISGLSLLDDDAKPLHTYWTNAIHVIGKDILWFHAVIWPCMLMSAGIPLPQRIAVHGFILDSEGKKMSKSLGNVIDPHDLLDKYPADTVRWYMCSSVYGLDFKFSTDQLEDYHRADLSNNLGNLVSRAVALSAGVVPDVPCYADLEKPFDILATVEQLEGLFKAHLIGDAAALIRQRTSDTNKWLADSAPWAVKDDAVNKATLIRIALEAVYVLAHFWAPFIPVAATVIFDKVGQGPRIVSSLKPGFNNLVANNPVSTTKSILFDPLRK
jgi:methionyl-tRNA synthetase